MKETERKIRARIKKFGGEINQHLQVVFPEALRINSRKEARDILDILINDYDDQGNVYTMEIDVLHNALKDAFERKVI